MRPGSIKTALWLLSVSLGLLLAPAAFAQEDANGECLECHGERGQPPRLDQGDAYEVLLDGSVQPGQARTSPLIWHLLGRRTDRRWDDVGADGTVAPGPVKGLTREDVLTFIQWIDLGALRARPDVRDHAPALDNSGGSR